MSAVQILCFSGLSGSVVVSSICFFRHDQRGQIGVYLSCLVGVACAMALAATIANLLQFVLTLIALAALLKFGFEMVQEHRYVVPDLKPSRAERLGQNGGSHTHVEWLEVCNAHQNRCVKCHRKRALTKDHIVPVCGGGSDNISNIQPLCRSCNSTKGTQTIDYRSVKQ